MTSVFHHFNQAARTFTIKGLPPDAAIALGCILFAHGPFLGVHSFGSDQMMRIPEIQQGVTKVWTDVLEDALKRNGVQVETMSGLLLPGEVDVLKAFLR